MLTYSKFSALSQKKLLCFTILSMSVLAGCDIQEQNILQRDAFSPVAQTSTENPETGFTTDANNAYWDGKVVNGADVSSFIALDKNFARDNEKVFWHTRSIPGADHANFVPINANFGKDAHSLYEIRESSMFPLPSIFAIKVQDPLSFQFIDDSYSKDSKTVYYKIHGHYEGYDIITIEDADPKTFIPISSEFSKDNSHVYFQRFALDTADQKSFELIDPPQQISEESSLVAKDKNTSFVRIDDTIFPAEDFASFEKINDYFYKDKDHVYSFLVEPNWKRVGFAINSADPQSFQIIHEHFAKDKNNVYSFHCTEQRGCYPDVSKISADTSTFEVLPEPKPMDIGGRQITFVAKDKNNFYLQEKYSPKLYPIADMDSFIRIDDSSYFKDTFTVYNTYFQMLKGVDLASFTVFETGSHGFFGKDKNSIYGGVFGYVGEEKNIYQDQKLPIEDIRIWHSLEEDEKSFDMIAAVSNPSRTMQFQVFEWLCDCDGPLSLEDKYIIHFVYPDTQNLLENFETSIGVPQKWIDDENIQVRFYDKLYAYNVKTKELKSMAEQ